MGFMDKAKKMAEQAQAKLDEAQSAFNERQSSTHPPVAGTPASGAPPVEYDKHGRPVPAAQPHGEAPEESRTPPHGDPLAAEAPAGAPAEAPKPKAPPSGGPGMTSGDPLGG